MDPGSRETTLRVMLGLAAEAHEIIMVVGIAAVEGVAPASGVIALVKAVFLEWMLIPLPFFIQVYSAEQSV
jgi:hypothetical protein